MTTPEPQASPEQPVPVATEPAAAHVPTAEDVRKLFGLTVLFVGVEAQHWTLSTFIGAARFARSLGVDTLCVKRADGSIKWYESAQQLDQERQAVLSQGCGYVPFLYAYGPKFGDQQIHDECAVLTEMMHVNAGSVVVDMEAEWDGAIHAAEIFNELMRPVPGILGITTWADPGEQNWLGVAAALAPCCNVWIPQRYDNWLAVQPLPPEMTIIHSGLDLSQEFGANNPLAIAARTHKAGGSVWLWEIAFARQSPTIVDAIVKLMHDVTTVNFATDALPVTAGNAVPDAGFNHCVVSLPGDTLGSLAEQLGLSNWVQDLYKPNMQAIEDAARRYGLPGSDGGIVLMAGVKLNYNA